MLVLIRRIGQTIEIGDNIVVTFLGFEPGDKARIGVDAPKNVPVHRSEVAERIRREEERAKEQGVEPPHKPSCDCETCMTRRGGVKFY